MRHVLVWGHFVKQAGNLKPENVTPELGPLDRPSEKASAPANKAKVSPHAQPRSHKTDPAKTKKASRPVKAQAAKPQSAKAQKRKSSTVLSDVLVVVAIMLIAAAVGVGLVMQAGLSLVVANLTGVAVFCGLLVLHKIMRRLQQAKVLQSEVRRLQTEVKRLSRKDAAGSGASPQVIATTAETPPLNINTASRAYPQTLAAQPHSEPAVPAFMPPLNGGLSASDVPGDLAPPQLNEMPPAPPSPPPMPQNGVQASEVAVTPQMSTPPMPQPDVMAVSEGGASYPTEVATQPSWEGQGIDANDPHNMAPDFGANPKAPPAFEQHFEKNASVPEAVPAEDAKGVRDVDVKKVHGLIKKLAEQVNAVEGLSLGRKKDKAPEPLEVQADQAVDDMLLAAADKRRAQEQDAQASPAIETERAMQASLQALDDASNAMRRFEPNEPALEDLPLPAPRLDSSNAQAVMQVSDAIANERIDIWLTPIHGLADRHAQHYEVSVSLRDPTGEMIDVSGLTDALRGTGLLPALDSARLVRTAQIGQRLADREQDAVDAALFSEITAEALNADQFLNVFANTYQARENFAGQLVIVFQQQDVRKFGGQAWATLHDMQNLGFRFALAGVTDLDMDFALLKSSGFAFVKLTSEAFLNGLPALGAQIPANDVCQHLALAGLTLVVDGIATEDELAKIFGFGVLLGQGTLFGGKRQVRSKPVQQVSAAAARDADEKAGDGGTPDEAAA